MATDLLRPSFSPHRSLLYSYRTNINVDVKKRFHSSRGFRRYYRPHHSIPSLMITNTLDTRTQTRDLPQKIEKQPLKELSVLLDVTGMMCGGCVSRVKSILSMDERVESAVVNMLTETAAIRLKPDVVAEGEMVVVVVDEVAECLAKKLTECGFQAKRRVSGMGVTENVKKWKETVKKKEELLVKSRNRVAFAWTLVALCCGSHASHILHSWGIHVAHGPIWDALHNSYVKGGLALGALLGPGRGYSSVAV